MTIDVAIHGEGMFQVEGLTVNGKEFVDTQVEGADHGMAYSENINFAQDIAEGALTEGLAVSVNGRLYLGDNKAGEPVE